jgi:hypothetical protein
MKAKPIFKLLPKILVLFILSILFLSVITEIVFAQADSDGDGLSDPDEVIFGTEPTDADTDDDGVPDGDEELNTLNPDDPDNDPDGDGWNNANDFDSDGDGILDGTEKGLTDQDIDFNATDQSKYHFYADVDPPSAHPGEDPSKYTTDMTKWDTDGDTLSDGDEDKNVNGKYEPSLGETDPNFKDFDDDGVHDDTDPDDDNDGMPDIFEKAFPNALDPLDKTDRDEDFDRDLFTNYREYLGNDNVAGTIDWSDPEDPESKPNVAPTVTFFGEDTVPNPKNPTEMVQQIIVEAKQKITFNDTLLKVIDESADKGLTYKWEWDDDSPTYVRSGVKPNDAPTIHTYDIPSKYVIVLTVVDDIGNEGVGKLIVDVTYPEGITGLKIKIPRDNGPFAEKNTIQRGGWVAYIIEDVRSGDTITIDFEVEQELGTLREFGVRVFVIPKKDLGIYEKNDISRKVIPRKYERYWSGPVNKIVSSKKIEINAEEDDDIVVIFDNRFYEEGKTHLTIDEPMKVKVKIERENSPMFFILGIIILIILIVAIITGAVLFYKTKSTSGVTKITREAAIETQRSLDREMAELEIEIQDSLRRQSVSAPMTATPLTQQAGSAVGAGAGAAGAKAPGTVPQSPRPTAGVGGTGTTAGQTPGVAGTGPAIPGSTPGEQPMLPSTGAGAAPQGTGSAPGQTPGSTPQPQMLPPAQAGSAPVTNTAPTTTPTTTPAPQQPQSIAAQSQTAQSPTAQSPTAQSPTQKPTVPPKDQ